VGGVIEMEISGFVTDQTIADISWLCVAGDVALLVASCLQKRSKFNIYLVAKYDRFRCKLQLH